LKTKASDSAQGGIRSGTPGQGGVRKSLRAPGTSSKGESRTDTSPTRDKNPTSTTDTNNSEDVTPAPSRSVSRASVRHASPDPRDRDISGGGSKSVATGAASAANVAPLGSIKGGGSRDQPSAGVSLGSVLPKISSDKGSFKEEKEKELSTSKSSRSSIITANRISITEMLKIDTSKGENDSASLASGSIGESSVEDDDVSIASVDLLNGILDGSQTPSGEILSMVKLPDVGEGGDAGLDGPQLNGLGGITEHDSVSLGSMASSVVSYKPLKVHLQMVLGPHGQISLQVCAVKLRIAVCP